MTKIGRPSKYRKSFIKAAEKYLEECINARKAPFLEELAMRLAISEDSIRRWSEANDDFCGAIDRIKNYQKLALMKLGLKSPSFIIFLLKANHGMIEAEKIQHEGKEDKPLNIIFTDVDTWKHAEAKVQK